MSERVVVGVRIGKRLAHVHPLNGGRVALFLPDQHQKEDLHLEVALTAREAIRLGRALLKQAQTKP